MGWMSADSWLVLPAKKRHILSSKTSRSAPEPTQPSIQWVSDVFYPGVKRAGREAYHSSPSSARTSILFMAKGHTHYCGLVPGQHVKNNKWNNYPPKLLCNFDCIYIIYKLGHRLNNTTS